MCSSVQFHFVFIPIIISSQESHYSVCKTCTKLLQEQESNGIMATGSPKIDNGRLVGGESPHLLPVINCVVWVSMCPWLPEIRGWEKFNPMWFPAVVAHPSKGLMFCECWDAFVIILSYFLTIFFLAPCV